MVKGSLKHLLWECKLAKTKIEPPYDLGSQLLGIYPKDKKSSLFRRYLPPTVSTALIPNNPDVESA